MGEGGCRLSKIYRSIIARKLMNSLYLGREQVSPMSDVNNQTRVRRPKPDSRRQAVLATIIDEYLVTGEPVGSHVVSEKFSRAPGWGSATIRNVMSELEELGLLEQPHTSAGRIPTDGGYRHYVDRVLDSAKLSKHDVAAIENI